MPAATDTSRTARLLALMKKGDDAFNARDFATVDTVHHPDMVAYVTGLAEPIYGREGSARRHRDPPDRKSIRPGVRSDHEVGWRPDHRNFRVLGLRPAKAADRSLLVVAVV